MNRSRIGMAASALAIMILAGIAFAGPRKYKATIETIPPGATLYVDDKANGALGKTPMSPKLAEGSRIIILELAGYEPQRHTIIVDKTTYKKTFTYTLPRAAGSSPAAATVSPSPLDAKAHHTHGMAAKQRGAVRPTSPLSR